MFWLVKSTKKQNSLSSFPLWLEAIPQEKLHFLKTHTSEKMMKQALLVFYVLQKKGLKRKRNAKKAPPPPHWGLWIQVFGSGNSSRTDAELGVSLDIQRPLFKEVGELWCFWGSEGDLSVGGTGCLAFVRCLLFCCLWFVHALWIVLFFDLVLLAPRFSVFVCYVCCFVCCFVCLLVCMVACVFAFVVSLLLCFKLYERCRHQCFANVLDKFVLLEMLQWFWGELVLSAWQTCFRGGFWCNSKKARKTTTKVQEILKLLPKKNI